MKLKVPSGDKYTAIKSKLRELKLSTVCEEARWVQTVLGRRGQQGVLGGKEGDLGACRVGSQTHREG